MKTCLLLHSVIRSSPNDFRIVCANVCRLIVLTCRSHSTYCRAGKNIVVMLSERPCFSTRCRKPQTDRVLSSTRARNTFGSTVCLEACTILCSLMRDGARVFAIEDKPSTLTHLDEMPTICTGLLPLPNPTVASIEHLYAEITVRRNLRLYQLSASFS